MTLLLVSATVCARQSWQKSWRVFGGSPKNVSFSTCQKMCSCRFAWHAWHVVTFDVFQEECVCTTVVRVKLACLWGKPQKRVFLHVLEDVVMSFCAAGVALCDTAHFTRFPPQFHTPHSKSTLHTLHFTLYTPHSAPLRSTLHALHSTLYTPHFTLHTPHSRLSTYTLHSHITHTPHSTLHTLHSTL